MLKLTPIARKLRNNATEAEKYLWSKINRKQLCCMKFRRQYIIENYIVDFVCLEKKLIIELDGGQHNLESTRLKDKERDDFLKSKGFIILRFWNNEIFENMDGVLETIFNTVNPHLNPPPQGEGV